MVDTAGSPRRRFVYSPDYEVDIGEHVFSPRKFRLVAETLRGRGEIIEPELAAREELLLVHTADWVDKVLASALSLDEEMKAELRVTPEVARAHRRHVGGTVLAARDALRGGIGLHAGGGGHHAFAGHGEGFCLLNDLAVAVRLLQKEGNIRRAAIVDLDAHQGNGTAAIFSGDPDVFTFSMHQQDIYPELKVPGSQDFGLPAGAGDANYLECLFQGLPAVLKHRPELVLYQSGVDGARGDRCGGLDLTAAGLKARDELVRDAFRGAGIPVAVTLGGGYADDIRTTVGLHVQTLEVFASV